MTAQQTAGTESDANPEVFTGVALPFLSIPFTNQYACFIPTAFRTIDPKVNHT
jgi:hypothetical protein